jgi:hypothetical protein
MTDVSYAGSGSIWQRRVVDKAVPRRGIAGRLTIGSWGRSSSAWRSAGQAVGSSFLVDRLLHNKAFVEVFRGRIKDFPSDGPFASARRRL